MNRIKSFDATGIAPNGILYSGDLNAIQDAAAAQTDLTQTVSVGALAVGESGLQLLHYGSGEARVSGALRTDGIFRGLGGIYHGSFTTTQRGTIASGFRPYGLVITNSTTNQLEWNSNTDASPVWYSIASDGSGYVNVTNGATFGGDTTLHRTAAATLQLGTATQAGTLQIGSTAQPGMLTLYGQTLTGIRLQFFNGTDTQPTFTQLTNGTHNWGPGGATATDTSATRTAPGILTITNTVNAITGFQINGTALAATHLSNGITGSGAIVLANAPAFTGVPTSVTPPTVDNSTKVATTAWVIAQGYVSTTGISVSSVFGRTGAITAQTGDYTAAQVTNAADKSASAIQTFTGNIGVGGAPTAVGGAAGATIESGAIVTSATAGTVVFYATVPGDTVYRLRIDNNGLQQWSTGTAAADTSIARGGAGILTVTNTVNAINGYQVNGVALAASHLSNGVSGSGAVILATSPGLQGAPTAPTATTGTNTTQIATTAFVHASLPTIPVTSVFGRTGAVDSLAGDYSLTDIGKQTQYALVVQGATYLASLATGTSGQLLQSKGSAANPAWTTATYPTTASTAGNVPRSNGTDFISTTLSTADLSDITAHTGSGTVVVFQTNPTMSGLTMVDGTNIGLGTTTGTKFGISVSEKIGFFNATPVVQQTNTTQLGTVNNSFPNGQGLGVYAGTTFMGTVGTRLYTIGDIVTALKNLGLIAA